MRIDAIFDRVIIRSGQFLMHRSKIELNEDNFKVLVEDALTQYSKFKPISKTFTKKIIQPRRFIFTKENTVEGIPDFISQATPIFSSGLGIPFFHERMKANSVNPEIDEPISATWDWDEDANALTVSSPATWSIVACYFHVVTEIPDDDRISYEVKTITTRNDLFHDLVRGMFMQGIGRSRRAFTIADLPITMDASEIVTDGETLEERTIEKLEQQMDFSLAYT